MKTGIYFLLFTSIISHTTLAQCTDGGLKVQSSTCEPPQNLTILSIGCSEMKLSWMGSKSGMYVVKATLWDSAKGNATVNEQQVTTGETGAAQATVAVKQRMPVSWTVQAVCPTNSYKLYSKEIAGRDTLSPVCSVLPDTMPVQQLVAYPNPATSYLMVEYRVAGNKVATLEVYSMEGKQMMKKPVSAPAGSGIRYKLNIASLPPGTYLLKVNAGKETTSEVKFIKARM